MEETDPFLSQESICTPNSSNIFNKYSESKKIRKYLAQRNLSDFDIIGDLPSHISILIFSYLSPEEVFKLRIVSKKWNKILRISYVNKRVIENYFPHERILYHNYIHLSNEEKLKYLIINKRNFENRKPTECKDILTFRRGMRDCATMAYCAGKLFYSFVYNFGDSYHMYTFKNGLIDLESNRFTTINDCFNKLDFLVCTKNLCAGIDDHNVLHSWIFLDNLSPGKVKHNKLELPKNNYNKPIDLIGSGFFLLILFKNSYEMILWNSQIKKEYSTNKISKLLLDLTKGNNCELSGVINSDLYNIVFCLKSDGGLFDQIVIVKFNGEKLFIMKINFTSSPICYQPLDSNLVYIAFGSDFLIKFNLGGISLKNGDVDNNKTKNNIHPSFVLVSGFSNLYLYKGVGLVIYGSTLYSSNQHIITNRLSMDISSSSIIQVPITNSDSLSQILKYNDSIKISGDHQRVCVLNHSGIKVYSFGPKIDPIEDWKQKVKNSQIENKPSPIRKKFFNSQSISFTRANGRPQTS